MEDAIELEKGLKPRGEKNFFLKKITTNNKLINKLFFNPLAIRTLPKKIGTKFQSFIDHFQV